MLYACLAVAAMAIGALFYAISALKAANRDIREIATEALLAIPAKSSEELAQASVYAHQMRIERQQMANPQPQTATVAPHDPDKVQLADGTILNIVKPFG